MTKICERCGKPFNTNTISVHCRSCKRKNRIESNTNQN